MTDAPSDSPQARLFTGLTPQPADPLLSLIGEYRRDPRADKIDLGVGVYRDADGATPVFAAVKLAEKTLQQIQSTKTYLGPEGDMEFLDRLQPVIFGHDQTQSDLVAVQTPGGTGALRIVAELANAGTPGARIWLGEPSWANHAPIFRAAGLQVRPYRYFDPDAQRLCFDEMVEAFKAARPGDLVVVHGCCHNPTGADPSLAQWRALAELVAGRGLVPLIDLAYQGMALGLEEDAAGPRLVMQAADIAFVAYSCDKNFGLYRERTGALFVRAKGQSALVRSNVLQLARCLWSMPPDHGAAVVRVILEDATLSRAWTQELDGMRQRLIAIRRDLAAQAPALAALEGQHGLFAQLALSAAQVERLRREHGVYMATSGRINLAGLADHTIPIFARALQVCQQRDYA